MTLFPYHGDLDSLVQLFYHGRFKDGDGGGSGTCSPTLIHVWQTEIQKRSLMCFYFSILLVEATPNSTKQFVDL